MKKNAWTINGSIKNQLFSLFITFGFVLENAFKVTACVSHCLTFPFPQTRPMEMSNLIYLSVGNRP